MKVSNLLRAVLIAIAILYPAGWSAWAQRGGGVPNATAEQSAAIGRLTADVAAQTQRLASARGDLVTASLAEPRNRAVIQSSVAAIRAAEQEFANACAEAFARMQASADRLSGNQVRALSVILGGGGGGRGAARTSMPHVTAGQANSLLQMTAGLAPQSQAVNAARSSIVASALETPRNDPAIREKLEALAAAEMSLANARADAMQKLQASPDRLDREQIDWLIAGGGTYGNGFTEPEPMDFGDHRGYVSLFDGVSLKGWDGNPKFWRAEGGAIVGESTPANPSGNTYIAYRDVTAKDFTLKFEIKIEGDGGSGLQYRSKTGIPWSRPIPANVTANVGPVNLSWMMTGPQADFWPSRIYTGQFYSENTPMGIMSYRGQVVEGAGLGAKRLMGVIGDRNTLGTLVKTNDWNQYTVIARGGTFIHIVNGQLMAVMVDDDPESSNNQPGIFGIEIEATTKVSVRNIWLKKLN
jgi:hypothetical protein